MNNLGYFIAKVKCRLMHGNKEVINDFFRKNGVKIGEGVKISSNILSAEPYLIEIGDDVTISHGVDFITHDNSVCKIFGVDHDLYGKIVIGNECFIGARAILMYGVTLPDRVIVAAGSVVTKSPQTGNVIIGGNPARVIGSLEQFGEKAKMMEIHAGHLSYAVKRQKVLDSVDRWVVR